MSTPHKTTEDSRSFWINEQFTSDHPTYLYLAVHEGLAPEYVLMLLRRGAVVDLHVELDAGALQLDVPVKTAKGLRMSSAVWAALHGPG